MNLLSLSHTEHYTHTHNYLKTKAEEEKGEGEEKLITIKWQTKKYNKHNKKEEETGYHFSL